MEIGACIIKENIMAGNDERPTSDQFSRTTLDLFDAYVHGIIDRRGFLQKCAAHVGSAAAASANSNWSWPN